MQNQNQKNKNEKNKKSPQASQRSETQPTRPSKSFTTHAQPLPTSPHFSPTLQSSTFITNPPPSSTVTPLSTPSSHGISPLSPAVAKSPSPKPCGHRGWVNIPIASFEKRDIFLEGPTQGKRKPKNRAVFDI